MNVYQYTWFFSIMRWSLMIIFILFWPYLIAKNYSEIACYRKERFRIAVWLLILELLIHANNILKLIHVL